MGKETVRGDNYELCRRLNTEANYSLTLGYTKYCSGILNVMEVQYGYLNALKGLLRQYTNVTGQQVQMFQLITHQVTHTKLL